MFNVRLTEKQTGSVGRRNAKSQTWRRPNNSEHDRWSIRDGDGAVAGSNVLILPMWKHNNRYRRRNLRPTGPNDNDRTRGGVAFVVVGTWLPKPQERVPGQPSIIIIWNVFVRCGSGMRLHAGGILNYIRLLFFLSMVLFYFLFCY